jgi:hypothetical protein
LTDRPTLAGDESANPNLRGGVQARSGSAKFDRRREGS